MIDPTRHRQLQELDTVNLSVQILTNARNELYMNMHFLDISLSGLGYEYSPSMPTIGTDGFLIYYNPEWLFATYRRGRVHVNRAYLHMVFHCLFCHMDTRGKRAKDYWNLACDIAMESIIDGLYKKCTHVPPSPYRRDIYLRLKKKMKVLTAEGIYKALQEMNLSRQQYERMAGEFLVDHHDIWYEDETQSQAIPRQSKWNDNREKMQTEMEARSEEESQNEDDRSLLEQVQIENRERYDYKAFLRKFAVLKEELQVDEDSFDYIYYTYGLEHYGNMPLIEPLESKEVFRVEDFVIVIDTSMSCQGALVKRFLEETYSVLSESESFFRKINIHIIQCDDKVQSDVVITSQRDMQDYMNSFTIQGKGGTDFRPAFEYVNGLRNKGEFTKLRGLLYFTDGKGIYPVTMPPYDTAFIFIKDQYRDESVPAWAMKLILEPDDLGMDAGAINGNGLGGPGTANEWEAEHAIDVDWNSVERHDEDFFRM